MSGKLSSLFCLVAHQRNPEVNCDYFLESSRIVTCAKGKEVKFSWTPAKPKQSGPEVKCLYKGNTVQNGTLSSNQEMSLHRGEERFEMATCAVQHKSVWIYSTRFVFWQDAVRFIPESKEMNNKTIEVKNGTYALTWSVEMTEPSLDQPFRCVANSHPICSGLTLTEEPGKCQIEMNAHGFLFTYLWNIADGRPGAFYCYLDNTVLAKSILNYGQEPTAGPLVQPTKIFLEVGLIGSILDDFPDFDVIRKHGTITVQPIYAIIDEQEKESWSEHRALWDPTLYECAP
nr:unnamed protein product [Spirometra erinaceieuropaei]